ncbi:hypothetical protein BGZ65_009963, partial [Modicella reniformis]
MNFRRSSLPITEESSLSTKPSLLRLKAGNRSQSSISSTTSSLSGFLLTAPSTTTATATANTTNFSTAILTNSHVSASSTILSNGVNSSNGPAATSSTYYPAFPYRNKSR